MEQPGKSEVRGGFFCTIGSITVREVLAPGDGRPLPSEVVLDGLVVPEPGTYDIINALVHANGSLRLQVDSATRVVQRVRGSRMPGCSG